MISYFNLDEIEALGLRPLIHLLDTYGQWPMTVSDWSESSFDWRRAGPTIRSNIGDSYLFSVYNHADSNNTDSSSLYVRIRILILLLLLLLQPLLFERFSNIYYYYCSWIKQVWDYHARRSWVPSQILQL